MHFTIRHGNIINLSDAYLHSTLKWLWSYCRLPEQVKCPDEVSVSAFIEHNQIYMLKCSPFFVVFIRLMTLTFMSKDTHTWKFNNNICFCLLKISASDLGMLCDVSGKN